MRTSVLPRFVPFLTAVLAALLAAAPAVAQSSGDLIITELMPDPDDVTDANGEYFEVYNDTDSDINLNGYTFSDEGTNSFTIDEEVTVPANGFAVLCTNSDTATNGGVSCDYEWSSFTLANGDDEVIIEAPGGASIFQVSYTDGNAFGAGVALELQDVALGQDGATTQADYQAAQDNIDGQGSDLGSPGAAGTTDGTGDGGGTPTVQFAESGATVDEDASTATLTVVLNDPDGSEVSVDVVFDAAESTAEEDDIGSFTSETVTFAAGSADGATQTVEVPVTDDAEDEGDETANFDLANATNATVGSPSSFDLSITDNDETVVESDLVINEFLADPTTSDGGVDLNNDGTSDSDDEFVEILNTGTTAIDLSDYQLDDIADGGGSPYTFPSGTTLQPGEGAVILGAADDPSSLPIPAAFVDDGLPALNNTGDDIRLLDDMGNVLASVTYDGALAFDGVSAARNPNGSGDFEAQNTFGPMTDETAGQNNNTGDPLGGDENPTTVQFAESGATVDEDAGTATLTVSISNPDGNETTVDVVFDADASSAEEGDIGDYVTQTVTFPATATDGATETVTVSITDDAEDEGDETANFDLANATNATVGSPSSFDLSITDNDETVVESDLVINEFMPDPNGAIDTDLNDDGTADTGDEFVEIFNAGTEAVDLSGYQLDDVIGSSGSPYTFPSGTTLAPGEYAVIINDANGQTFGAFTDSGVPSLNNGGDEINLLDDAGNVLASVTYGSDLVFEGVSAARNPNGSGDFQAQNTFGEMVAETAGQNNETGTGNDDGAGGEADIAVTPTSVDFGNVEVGMSAEETVTVSNEGEADLQVTDVSVGGDAGFALASGAPTSFTLAPSESQDIGVVFAPSATGTQSGTLTITSDDADEGSVDVGLSGTGTEEVAAGPSPNAWFNEVHYDNDGTDTGEFVEIVIERADTLDLSELQIVLYNGNGGGTYGSTTVDQLTAGATSGNFTLYAWSPSSIQNGPDGFALCYQGAPVESGGATQFLSYEGTFDATEGCANGLTSTDIGVQETTSTPVGQSLQLTGTGTTYPDFTWTGPSDDSPGQVNTNQTLGEGAVQDATVTFEDQVAPGGQTVIVASAFLPRDGYIAIHDSTLLDGNVLGSVIGVSEYLPAGSYTDVVVDLFDVPGQNFPADTSLPESQTLIAMPHEETSDPMNMQYNFITSDGAEDGPFFENEDPDEGAVTDAAFITVPEAQDVATVTFNDQVAPNGQTVTVASVTVPDGGFIAIHDSTLLDGNVLGSVIGVSDFLAPGAYTDVVVDLFDVPGQNFPADTSLPESQTLIAMPHRDTNGNEVYDFITSDGNADGPYFEDNDPDQDAVTDPAFITVPDDGIEPGEDDTTPPVCGAITFERNTDGDITTVLTSATDEESGIASVAFTRLRNVNGFAGGQGPFSEGETATFDPAATTTVEIRAERISFSEGGTVTTTVTNGDGLSQQCDPVLETISAERPTRFALKGNYPNPVRAGTTIEFALSEAAEVTLEVYDLLGRRVAVLVDGQEMAPATYQVRWEANGLPSGTYVYRLKAGTFSAARQMILVR